jgi:hypothetical protein
LNGDITDATSVENELTVTFGTVFEPLLDDPDPEPDDPQAAAVKLTTPARARRLVARKLLLFPRFIPQDPFRPKTHLRANPGNHTAGMSRY